MIRPILMSTMMAKALSAGTKFETRRTSGLSLINANPGDWISMGNGRNSFEGTWHFVQNSSYDLRKMNNGNYNQVFIKCPYGVAGEDELVVREGFAVQGNTTKSIVYKADFLEPVDWNWKPGIHMPLSAARFLLPITSISVHRIADISEEECIAEGVERNENGGWKDYETIHTGKHRGQKHPHALVPMKSAYHSYRSLWQELNGQPKPVQSKVGGKLITVGYIVYPFDEQAATPYAGMSHWRGKPLNVIVNPWVWAICWQKITNL